MNYKAFLLFIVISSQCFQLKAEQETNNQESVQQFLFRFLRVKALLAPRDYETRMTDSEKMDLHYILDTLANSSMMTIGFKKKYVEQASSRIAHIHPLRIMIEMLNDPINNVNLHRIRQRSMIWSALSEQYAETLDEENNLGNVMPHLFDFCHELNIAPSYVQAAFEKAAWDEVFELLLEI